MASSYTLSFTPLTVVVSRRSASPSPSSSLIPPPSLLGKKLLVTQPSRRRFFSKKHRCLTSASTVFSVPTAWVFDLTGNYSFCGVVLFTQWKWELRAVCYVGFFLQAAGEWFFGQDPKVSLFESFLYVFFFWIVEWFIRFDVRWSARAIKSLAMGELEARKLKYPTTGSEAILMGILVEGLCVSSQNHVCFSLFYLLCLLL